MGLLRKIFHSEDEPSFKPNSKLSEYDNWLNFLSCGGTDNEWNKLKTKNGWEFKEDSTEKFMRYEKEFRPIWNAYYKGQNEIESQWTVMYNLKCFSGGRAKKFENICRENIDTYKKMIAIDKKYGERSVCNIPAYKRLAMLHEKQGNFEKAIAICKESLSVDIEGLDMQNRLTRIIKKAGREPSVNELELLKNNTNTTKDPEQPIKSGRMLLDPEEIDKNQRIPASQEYCELIYNKWYSAFKEKPFISKDREIHTDWIELADMFPDQCIIKKQTMKRYKNGLLPGHIYQLYGLDKYSTNRRIPSYFEYKYGIEFEIERIFLMNNGYLDSNNKPTQKGLNEIKSHHDIIDRHKNG